jgi:hypothetical protein
MGARFSGIAPRLSRRSERLQNRAGASDEGRVFTITVMDKITILSALSSLPRKNLGKAGCFLSAGQPDVPKAFVRGRCRSRRGHATIDGSRMVGVWLPLASRMVGVWPPRGFPRMVGVWLPLASPRMNRNVVRATINENIDNQRSALNQIGDIDVAIDDGAIDFEEGILMQIELKKRLQQLSDELDDLGVLFADLSTLLRLQNTAFKALVGDFLNKLFNLGLLQSQIDAVLDKLGKAMLGR